MLPQLRWRPEQIMRRRIPDEQRAFAKTLRTGMTSPEQVLWHALKAHRLDGWHFRRQAPIGPYIADFVCFEARLIIELDGDSHDSMARFVRDAARDDWFAAQGFRTLRFSNRDVAFADQTIRTYLPKPDLELTP